MVPNTVRGPVLSNQQVGIVEPTEEFVDTYKGLLGRILVKNQEKVPLRFMNLSNETQTIHEGTIVGQLSPVEEIMVSEPSEPMIESSLPAHMQQLYKDTVKNMPENKRDRLPCKQCNHCNIEKDTAVGYSQNIQSKNRNESNKVSVITELQEAQNADTNISKVREWLEKGERPSWEEVCGSYFMRSLWSQFNRLCIENELVCRTWEIGSTNITYCQAVVPLCERRKILEYCHDVRTSEHQDTWESPKR
ncbi:unnamed protein product [Mytilus edulis]|uniref:Uncharacterized protein n=1 Tax=Mytilus edulis TaxID=6550 RepID=A0A8S3UAQ0_MYTED|nr:unnamed protein product [Mytilus edulis]